MNNSTDLRKLLSLPVIVATLGYFVDIYDLLLFSVVRKASLQSLGVATDQLLSQGEHLLRIQMFGLLTGGLVWGVMGDKRGRLSVLFGSILLYSLANIANGFVTTVEQYAWLRFIAGVGLAGELGAGITLALETLPKEIRGYGTTVIVTFGLLGAVLANVVSRTFEWHIAYFIGGGLGIALLIARVSVLESGMFLETKEKGVRRGDFLQLFRTASRLRRFLGCIFLGMPIWFVIGSLITFAPEMAAALGVPGEVAAGDAVMISYLGLTAGDLASGILSQVMRTRKKVVAIFISLTLAFIVLYLFSPWHTQTFFFVTCFCLGFGVGYWALFVTISAEQFGTNLRMTVATSVPNFIRGTVIPLTLCFKFLRDYIAVQTGDTRAGIVYGALIVGVVAVGIAYIALSVIDETFGRDLNYDETN